MYLQGIKLQSESPTVGQRDARVKLQSNVTLRVYLFNHSGAVTIPLRGSIKTTLLPVNLTQ